MPQINNYLQSRNTSALTINTGSPQGFLQVGPLLTCSAFSLVLVMAWAAVLPGTGTIAVQFTLYRGTIANPLTTVANNAVGPVATGGAYMNMDLIFADNQAAQDEMYYALFIGLNSATGTGILGNASLTVFTN